jgi:hypothetical protein
VVRSARAGHVRCSARFTGRKCRSRVWISLSAKPILASGRKTRKQAGHMSASDPSMLPELILQVGGRPHMNRAARRLGHPASIPRAIMSRSPEALAFGSRRHFIPASLSLPLCGCLLNRSRDCSRSRVPPRFPRRRYADAPAAASFSCLRFASARFRQSPVRGTKLEARSDIGAIVHRAHVPFWPDAALARFAKGRLIHK